MPAILNAGLRALNAPFLKGIEQKAIRTMVGQNSFQPMSKFQAAACKREAELLLAQGSEKHRDRFNQMKTMLDASQVSLNMVKKKFNDKDWRGYNLQYIDFSEAKLTNIRAANSNMSGAQLVRTKATDCNFDEAHFKNVDALLFSARTSTFNQAVVSGNWHRSSLPAAFRERRGSIHILPNTQLTDVSIPLVCWDVVKAQAKMPNTPNMVAARNFLIAKAQETESKQFAAKLPPQQKLSMRMTQAPLKRITEEQRHASQTPLTSQSTVFRSRNSSLNTVFHSNSGDSLSKQSTKTSSLYSSTSSLPGQALSPATGSTCPTISMPKQSLTQNWSRKLEQQSTASATYASQPLKSPTEMKPLKTFADWQKWQAEWEKRLTSTAFDQLVREERVKQELAEARTRMKSRANRDGIADTASSIYMSCSSTPSIYYTPSESKVFLNEPQITASKPIVAITKPASPEIQNKPSMLTTIQRLWRTHSAH